MSATSEGRLLGVDRLDYTKGIPERLRALEFLWNEFPELRERLTEFQQQGKLLELQRLQQRTTFDLEMIQEIGYCQGIENYSRHLTGRPPGAGRARR